MTANEGDDPVGYGRPPKHTQFAKGKSGNPKGRPKGSKNFSTLLHDELNVKIPITENGKRRKITKQEAMVKQLANKGAAGDLKAIPIVMNDIRLREGLPGADPSGVVREEDQKVMASIVKRMREAAPPVASSDVTANLSEAPEPAPTTKTEDLNNAHPG
jgi:hypothetical protein